MSKPTVIKVAGVRFKSARTANTFTALLIAKNLVNASHDHITRAITIEDLKNHPRCGAATAADIVTSLLATKG